MDDAAAESLSRTLHLELFQRRRRATCVKPSKRVPNPSKLSIPPVAGAPANGCSSSRARAAMGRQ
jgi:hypothetical protein